MKSYELPPDAWHAKPTVGQSLNAAGAVPEVWLRRRQRVLPTHKTPALDARVQCLLKRDAGLFRRARRRRGARRHRLATDR